MANYHPSNELLMQFAAGQTSNALGLIIACHLEKCPHCRQRVSLYEHLGGNLVESLKPQTVSDSLLDNILLKIDSGAASANDAASSVQSAQSIRSENKIVTNLPKPLRRFVNADFDSLAWTGMSNSIKEFKLPIADDVFTAKLYKITAGKELPEHTHRGNEFTLVMQGGFSDKAGSFDSGDFVHTDPMVIHRPKAHDDGDCICFAVMDAPLKMTGFFGRMLNPFMS